MWFELQKVETACSIIFATALHTLYQEGVQAAFGTMKTLYPLLVDIEEAASLFRRGGGTSIITIGDSHVSDFGKGIRQYLELGARSSTDFISAQNSNIQKPTISLASVGTDVCLHGLTTWSHLHPQEDLLVKRYSRRPEVLYRECHSA